MAFALAVVAAACTAATSVAQVYKLDTGWPLPGQPQFNNIEEVTAIAVVGNSTSGKVIHVAQRNASVPFFIVLDVKGQVTGTWGNAGVTSPHGLLAGPDGSSIWVVDILGTVVSQWSTQQYVNMARIGSKGAGINPPQFSAPADMAFTAAGNIVVSDGDGGSNNRVLVLDGRDWTKTLYDIEGSPKFSSPHSVAYEAAADRIWVADRGNSRLQVFAASNGTWLFSWEAASCFPGGAPWGVRLDEARGHVLVPDGGMGCMYVLGARPGGACTLLQNITVGLALKPHLVGMDVETGDVYVANVGTPPGAQRYVRV